MCYYLKTASIFLAITGLFACQQTPKDLPIQVALLNIPHSTSHLNSLHLQSDRRDLFLLNSPIVREEIDPLTRYMEKYQHDPVMLPYIHKANQQREQLCEQMGNFYRSQFPLTEQQLTQIAGDFSYSCPYIVADIMANHSN
ncbi:hypothetical protein [Thioflexithrix psekupsensis]|uniref:Uncharacterized protein n=1 Tax=Thioflexithrix psekupsensis TaxID=1570016 RepID=A0A251X7M0_9GAMM|nr:hypothetical protein [Thioflexithrix psekupsensis]OUD13930.1 hypothetical protein TPSD3_06185 [Thioflexithrix psekupsensis]